MDKKRLGLWVPILVLAAALVMFAVSTGEVEAGGRGKPKPPPTNATCWFTPNPATSGQAVVEFGSGFAPYTTYGYSVSGASGSSMGFIKTDSSGGFSMSGAAGPSGTYRVAISGNGVYATCTLQVV